MAKVKFSPISHEEFHKLTKSNPDALLGLHDPDIDVRTTQFGKVQIPGCGWRLCILEGDSPKPVQFYDSDDGWNRCPPVEYALLVKLA